MRSFPLLSRLGLMLSLLAACAPATPPTTSPSPATALTSSNTIQNTSTQTDIRPNSKGQRLEVGDVEGEFSLPSGTSAFLVQSQMVHFNHFNLDLLLGAPAYAQDMDEISDDQIRQFKARIDDEAVTMVIDKISRDANGERVVAYHLTQVPVLEINQVLEFYSPSETINLKGLLPQIKANVRTRLNQRIDLDSTAAVEVIQRDSGSIVHQITPDELRDLAKRPEVIEFRDFMKVQIKRKDNKQRKFTAIIEEFDPKTRILPKLQAKLDDLNTRQLKQCAQNPEQCLQVLKQCRPTQFKVCPKPEDRLNQARAGIVRPGILFPRAASPSPLPPPRLLR
jgi:hypothetical protein